MRALDAATAVIFALFLALPIGSAAVSGFSGFHRAAPDLAKVTPGQLVAPADDRRSAVVRAVITHSPIGGEAIRGKSQLDYLVFGNVSTSQVVSGEDGWLFFKEGFNGGNCLSAAEIARAIDDVATMQMVGSAAGVELLFSVSPDKVVVHPEKLGLRAGKIAGCKLESAAAWRSYATESKSGLIDHLSAMRERDTSLQAYLATDTHWNDYGKVVAMRQLMLRTLEGTRDCRRPALVSLSLASPICSAPCCG